jgi:ribosomal protein S18 acetylase RimI-like enzyme
VSHEPAIDERNIRPATAADAVAIEAFTHDTFSWGDYVAEQFLEWLEDDRSLVLVGTDADDTAVAVGRVLLLSDREAWFHGARVHPEHRRQGYGRAINDVGCRWAADRGAGVARLMVEDWNAPARSQVATLEYRPVGSWLWCDMDLSREPMLRSPGGQSVPREERLTRARATESDMAWMAWSSSDLARAARELFPIGWHYRRMRPGDLRQSAERRRLWSAPSGWILQDTDQGGAMVVSWLATSDLDADRLVRAIIDLADGARAGSVRVMIPNVEWLVRAVVSAGFEPHPATVYARTLEPGESPSPAR